MFKYTLTFFIILLASNPVLADSAEAWKTYQDGRDPMMELGLLVVGVVIFFVVLFLASKAVDAVDAKKKRVKKSSKRN